MYEKESDYCRVYFALHSMLFPIPLCMKDGGTVKYQAILYSISDVHRLSPSKPSGYEEGIIINILGMQVFNSVP